MKKRIYLYKSGSLVRSDNSLLFYNAQEKIYLPINQLEIINVFNHCNINKNTVILLNRHGVILNFFNYYGDYTGSFVPRNPQNGDYIIKQVECLKSESKRTYIVKEIIYSSIVNMQAVLKYYQKKGRDLSLEIKKIEGYKASLLDIVNDNDMMLIEAKSKNIYYSSFNKIIKNPFFIFLKRTVNPPTDAINAIMSYGYSILYSIFANIIYRSHLSISLPFIHGTSRKNEALKFDLADIYKPVLVDKLIFRLINKKQVNESHFVNNQGRVYLNKDGASLFINWFEEELRNTIQVTEKQKLSKRSLLSREVHNLSNYVFNNKKYLAYKMKW